MESQVSLEKTERMVVQESGENGGHKENRGRQPFPILNLNCTSLPLQWSMKQEREVALEPQSP
jgi:hypothetical protein